MGAFDEGWRPGAEPASASEAHTTKQHQQYQQHQQQYQQHQQKYQEAAMGDLGLQGASFRAAVASCPDFRHLGVAAEQVRGR